MPWRAGSRAQIRALTRGVGRQLEREHHPPKDGLAHPAGAVHGPEGRRRRRLEQPVHVHLGARVAEGHARGGPKSPHAGNIGKKVLHLVEQEERTAVPGEQALGEPKLLEAFPAQIALSRFATL